MQNKRFYPWLIWFLASSFIFYKYLLEVSPSVMVPDLMKTFSLTAASLGNLAAFYFYAYFAMQLPAGILLDKYNPRYMLTKAILLCAVGAYVFSQADSLMLASIGRLLIGLGGAFSAVGTMKLISIWFPPKRFALVSGLMMTMAMLGAIMGQTPIAFSVSVVGWRDTMVLCSLVGFVLALAVWLVIRDKKEPVEIAAQVTYKQFGKNLLTLIKNKQSWLVSLYSGLAFAPVAAFAGLWGVPFITQKCDTSRAAAAALVSLIFVGFAVGSPLAGWFSDRINRRKPPMIMGTFVSLLTISAVIYVDSLSHLSLSILLVIFGFASGFFFVSFANMREINSSRLSGTSIGFINMFNAMCGALAEPLIGKVLDLGWDHKLVDGARVFSTDTYQHALTALPVVLLIALGLLFFIKETKCQSID